MNIEEGEIYCQEIVHSFIHDFRSETILKSLSWGSKREFITSDPYNEVRITEDKVIINENELTNQRWLIEYTRGLLFINWPYTEEEDPIDIDHKWDYTKLIAVFLIQPKAVSDRIKLKYINDWQKQIHLTDNTQVKYDLNRIYNILKVHSRKFVLDMLGSFLFNTYDPMKPKPFMNQFHFSLFNALSHPLDYDQIDLIDIALRHQTLKLKDLTDLMTEHSQSKVYSLYTQMDNLISEFILPCRRILGLFKFHILNPTASQIEQLKKFDFFEAMEEFVDETKNFVRLRIAKNSVLDFVQQFKSTNSELESLILIPDRGEIRISPEMYNPDTKTYFSVKEVKVPVIQMTEDQKTGEILTETLTYDEMKTLYQLLKVQDDNPIKNYFEYSQSQTKNYIRNLNKKNAYYRIILTRKGAELKTVVSLIDLTEELNIKTLMEKELKTDPSNYLYHLLDEIDTNLINYETLNSLKSYSWPYLTIEYGIHQLNKSSNTFRIVALVRISVDPEDLEMLYRFGNVIGIQNFNQGSSQVIPYDYYNTGYWKYPLNELLDLLYV